MRCRVALLLTVTVVLAAVVAGCRDQARKPSGNSADVKVTTCGFDGVEAAIAAAKGRVVLIDCWATWCGPCVRSFPELVARHEKYAAKGLTVISLSLDSPDTSNEVISFLRKNNATFTNLHLKGDDSAQRGLEQKLGYQGTIPHAAVFGKTGNRVWTGHPMDEELQKTIEAELEK